MNALTGRATLLTYTSLRDDRERLQKTMGMVFWVSANVALPLVLALFISAPDLVLFLYGPVWQPVAPLLRILVLAALLRPVLENLLTLAVALGQPRRLIETAAVQLGTLVLLGTPLTLRWGATGTAVAAVVTVAVGVGVVTLRLSPGLLYKPLRSFRGPVVAAALTVVLYVLVLRMVDTNSLALWLRVVVKFGYAFGAYGFLCWSWSRTRRENGCAMSIGWREARKRCSSLQSIRLHRSMIDLSRPHQNQLYSVAINKRKCAFFESSIKNLDETVKAHVRS